MPGCQRQCLAMAQRGPSRFRRHLVRLGRVAGAALLLAAGRAQAAVLATPLRCTWNLGPWRLLFVRDCAQWYRMAARAEPVRGANSTERAARFQDAGE